MLLTIYPEVAHFACGKKCAPHNFFFTNVGLIVVQITVLEPGQLMKILFYLCKLGTFSPRQNSYNHFSQYILLP